MQKAVSVEQADQAQDRESVRVAKANAAQEARRVNASKKIATQWLGKFVKASFNINSLMKIKFVKRTDPANKEQLIQARATVQELVKKLQLAMQGKDVDFEQDECKTVFAKATVVTERLLSFAHANACKF